MDLGHDGRFKAMDIELISVMADAPFDLKPEAEKREVTSIVASDVTLTASKDYGVLGKSMHPGLKPGHTFILVDRSGKIAWRWDWSENLGSMYLDLNTLDDQLSQVVGEPGS